MVEDIQGLRLKKASRLAVLPTEAAQERDLGSISLLFFAPLRKVGIGASQHERAATHKNPAGYVVYVCTYMHRAARLVSI